MKKNNKNTVEKRESLDNSVIEELNQKYPKVNVNGVAYDLGLTYYTIETNYLTSVNVRKLIKERGAEAIAVICFFRQEMCQPYGWCCRIDGDYFENLIEKCAFTLKMSEEDVKAHYQAMLENKIFFLLNDEKGSYLADVQQLYNFEILNNSRIIDRERKAKARKKAKEQEIIEDTPSADIEKIKTIETVPEAPVDDFLNFNDEEEDFF